MALVADPVARAQRATTKLQAARLHLELESELGLNDAVPADWEEQADAAIRQLEQRASSEGWGDLRDVHVGGDGTQGWTPSLSRGARRGEGGTPTASGRTRRRATSHQTAAVRTRRAASARRRLTAARVASYAPNVPGYVTGRELAGAALWGGLGLVLLYLLLSDAENPSRGWPSAVQAAVRSTTNAVMAIVRPVDPLHPHAAPPPTPAERKAAQLSHLPHLSKTPQTPGPSGRLAGYPH